MSTLLGMTKGVAMMTRRVVWNWRMAIASCACIGMLSPIAAFGDDNVSKVIDQLRRVGAEWTTNGHGGLESVTFARTGITDSQLKSILEAASIQKVAILDERITELGLSALGNVHGLEELYIACDAIGDDDLKGIGSLRNLRELSVSSSRVRGEVLKHIGQLQRLERLRLSGCPVGDEHMRHLMHLRKLTSLSLAQTRISDKVMNVVVEMKGIRNLNLCMTSVSDEATWKLARMKGLRSLYLAETNITDAGLRNISCLRSLEVLNIRGPVIPDWVASWMRRGGWHSPQLPKGPLITDSGIAVLGELNNLRFLNVVGTDVTEDGIEQLRKRLPSCRIIHQSTSEPARKAKEQ